MLGFKGSSVAKLCFQLLHVPTLCCPYIVFWSSTWVYSANFSCWLYKIVECIQDPRIRIIDWSKMKEMPKVWDSFPPSSPFMACSFCHICTTVASSVRSSWGSLPGHTVLAFNSRKAWGCLSFKQPLGLRWGSASQAGPGKLLRVLSAHRRLGQYSTCLPVRFSADPALSHPSAFEFLQIACCLRNLPCRLRPCPEKGNASRSVAACSLPCLLQRRHWAAWLFSLP